MRALFDVLADADGFVNDASDWRFTLPDGATPRLDEIATTTTTSSPRPTTADATTGPPGTNVLDVVDGSSPAAPNPQRRRLLDIFRRRAPDPLWSASGSARMNSFSIGGLSSILVNVSPQIHPVQLVAAPRRVHVLRAGPRRLISPGH